MERHWIFEEVVDSQFDVFLSLVGVESWMMGRKTIFAPQS